jgi:hypothetical protein
MGENLGIKYHATENGVRATWRRRIEDWDDVAATVDSTWGATISVAGETFTIGFSTLPGREWMVLSAVDIEFWEDKLGADDSNGLPTCPEGALLVMEYDTLAYEIRGVQPPSGGGVSGEAFFTHTVDSTVNMMTHSQSALRWDTAAPNEIERGVMAAFPVIMVQHQFQWHHIFNPPLASLYGIAGKINDDTFLGHGAGTVLFNKVGATYKLSTDRERRYTLTLGCTARIIHGTPVDGGNITWNHFLRSDPGTGINQWQKIVEKESGDDILDEADFDDLLTLFGYTHPTSRPLSPP